MENPEDDAASTSDRVAANLRALRRDRGLDLADLSARMDALGHPLGVNALSKIELQKRRVDVEDLIALALALEVTPNRLLLTAEATGELVHLTSGFAPSSAAAWRWASGDYPLPTDPWSEHPSRGTFSTARYNRFAAENRPHTPDAEPITAAILEEHADGLGDIMMAIHHARSQGVPMGVIRAWFRLHEEMQSLAERVKRARERFEDRDKGRAAE